ncbi:FecR family protein [Chitinophaga polysaccharea]|uniref:FecR domain-containing protein n=1 Tax=Chitinophaga polysaccharea TaxID=1293035 RepID=UPI0014556022|nr:FecR domain-containing protein [Chitinophaga polysaccharea]NLR58217.1 FecR family protein [Chitinophaga polysaccharea]
MQRFRSIIKAYLDGKMSAEELSKHLAAHDEELHTEMQEQLESGMADGLTSPDSREAMFTRVMESVKEKEPGKIVFYKHWLKVAAILLPLIAVAGWWYYRSDMHPAKIAQHPLVVTPKKKVILTLSDGTAVELDSSGNGMVARQGNTLVLKQGNGQVVYQPSSDKSSEVLYNKISTPKGETFQVTLPDGSTALLNAASSIRFPTVFAKNDREVEVTGEVYFEIEKSPTPFHVKAPGTEIQVLGTKFNVNGYTDENALKVTLLEGAVKVAGGKDNVLLRPGQQAILTGDDAHVKEHIDLEEVMAWKKGNFVFNSLTIPEIMRQICRWYDVEVSYDGPVSQKRFTGIVGRNDSIAEVLEFMQTAGIKYKVNNRKIVIIP